MLVQTGQLYALTNLTSSNLLLHLYSNNRTPAKTDVLADYTEIIFVGYTAATLTSGGWSFAIDGTTTNYVASYAEQTFFFDDTLTIYGYYVTNAANTSLIFAALLPNAPIQYSNIATGNVKITPTIEVQ